MGWYIGGDLCCCGGTLEGCTIGEDDFTRTAPKTIGSDWVAGTASETWGITTIGSDDCAYTEDADAYLRYETAHPHGVAEHVVYVTIRTDVIWDGSAWVDAPWWTHGDKARIVLCDTLFAELEFGFIRVFTSSGGRPGGGCVIIRLFQGSTLLQESPTVAIDTSLHGGRVGFWAGYSETTGVLWASFVMRENEKPITVFMKENVGTVSGTKVGIGTGDTVNGQVVFSSFRYFHHNYGTVVMECFEPGDEEYQDCEFVHRWYGGEEDPITDLGCGWEILSGTWKSVSTSSFTYFADYLITTSSNAKIGSIQEQSEWNCSEYTDLGYHRIGTGIQFGHAGDVAIIYVDWDGTNGHWVEITCGNSSGNGCIVKLGKGAATLETHNIPDGEGARPSVSVTVQVCTGLYNGEDTLFAKVGNVKLASVTTVYGNGQVAFGTGSITSEVRFTPPAASANINACENCAHPECERCPGGDMPRGFSLEVTGASNNTSSPCDCEDFNATFAVPTTWSAGTLSCVGGLGGEWCTTYIGYVPCYWRFGWTWKIESITGGWRLRVQLSLIKQGYFCGSGSYFLDYVKDFTSGERCDTIADEVLAFDREWGTVMAVCDGLKGLTIKATAYD